MATLINDPDQPDPNDKSSAFDFIGALEAKMEQEVKNLQENALTEYWRAQARDVAMVYLAMVEETKDVELSRKITEMFVSVSLMKQSFPPQF